MKRVLIIDDDEDVGIACRMFLEENCIPYVFSDELEAINFYRKDSNFDFVFCDFRMNLLNGGAVLGALDRINPSPKKVLITSSVEAARSTGYLVIDKPFIFDRIIEMLNGK